MAFRVKRTVWTIIVTFLLCMVFQLTAFADNEKGWVTEDGHTYYYEDGVKLTGWQTIDGETYYFKKSGGAMVTGKCVIGKKTYYFAEDGKRLYGWQTIDTYTYFFDPENDGVMATGLIQTEGRYFYFNDEGHQLKGWRTIGDDKYYFRKSDGKAVVGLCKISKKQYFFSDEGVMQTGWQTVDDVTYYFLGSGIMATGTVEIDGATYIFDENGHRQTSGWVTIDGVKRYYDEEKGFATGLTATDEGTYYFNSNGTVFKGWKVLEDGERYFRKSDGKMATGWTTVGTRRYFFNLETGITTTGWFEWEGSTYYLGATTGRMSKGFTTVDGKKYYFGTDGKMWTGWHKIDTYTYYFDAETGAMATGITKIEEASYFFDASGHRKTGWQTIDSLKYYFKKSDGSMVHGLVRLSTYYYFFNEETGQMMTGAVTINGYACKFGKPSGKLLNSVVVPADAQGLFTAGGEEVFVTDRGTATYITYIKNPYEDVLKKAGFPSSYYSYLTALHKKYPDWEFVAYDPGVTWTQAVAQQYLFDYENSDAGMDIHYLPSPWYGTKAVSLIALDEGHPASWFSNEVRAKKCYTGFYKTKQSDGYYYATGFDSGNYTIASKDIIAYYMDPRNFLDPDGKSVFQFLDLKFNSTQTTARVQTAAKAMGSDWLSKTAYKHENGDTVNYPKLVYNAGKEVGFNPFALVSLMTQEMGTSLKTSAGAEKPAISGTAEFKVYLLNGKTETRKGFYNYFYIGGYADGTYSAWQRALWFASGATSGKSTSYGRVWNTRQKAITGGAKYFYTNYLAKGQNTLYKKRFNCNDNQYCTNIDAAWAEGWLLGKAYTEALRTGTSLKFYIPVYKNMPSKACALPK